MNYNRNKYYVEGSDLLTEAETLQMARDLRALELRGILEYRGGRWRLAAGVEIEETPEGSVMPRSDPKFAGPSVIGSDKKKKHMKEDTPAVQTAGFVATKDEIENLAFEYWNDVIDFKWDRFTWPDEPINTPQMDSFRLALIRLGDIAAVLGNERMEAIRYIALDRFRSPFTTDEQWSAFMAYAPMFLRPVEVTL